MPRAWTNKVLVRDQSNFVKRIILCAPHGRDDDFTADMVDYISNKNKYRCLINGLYDRNAKVNTSKRKADCNRISHIEVGTIKSEFLDPLLKMTNDVTLQSYPALSYNGDTCLVVQFHGYNGTSNKFKSMLSGNAVTFPRILIGTQDPYNGPLSSHFCSALGPLTGYSVALADVSSKYAGIHSNNVNMLFRNGRYFDRLVDSVQLEIDISLRSTRKKAIETADRISDALDEAYSRVEFGTSTRSYTSHGLDIITES